MTLTKAGLARKIAYDCRFMKGEATEVLERLLGDTKDDPRNLLTRVICSVISPRLSHQGGNSPRKAILSSLPAALVSAPTGIFIKLRMLIF